MDADRDKREGLEAYPNIRFAETLAHHSRTLPEALNKIFNLHEPPVNSAASERAPIFHSK